VVVPQRRWCSRVHGAEVVVHQCIYRCVAVQWWCGVDVHSLCRGATAEEVQRRLSAEWVQRYCRGGAEVQSEVQRHRCRGAEEVQVLR